MPTTYVDRLPHLQGRINYVLYGNGPGGTKARHERNAIRALATWCSFATPEQMGTYARKVRERFGNRKYEGFEIRVSWSREELIPESEEDVLRAMEFGHALIVELFPESPYMIVAQGDGVGQCLHLHIEVANVVDMQTCRAIRGYGRANWQVRAVTDVLSRERQMRVVRPAAHAGAWAERAQELEAAIDRTMEQLGPDDRWTHSLRDNVVALRIGTIIDRVITRHAAEIQSVDDLERHLNGYGVGIKRKQLADGSEGWTYTCEVELEGKKRVRRCKASKILSAYAANNVMSTVAAERERQEQVERERIEQEQAEARARQEAAEHWRAEKARKKAEQEERAERERLERERQEEEKRLAAEQDARDAAEREARLRQIQEDREREQESMLAALRVRAQERERELQGAVRVASSHDGKDARVVVNAALVGSDESLWVINVKSDAVATYAGAALVEMPRGASRELREELRAWRDGTTDDFLLGTPAKRVAEALGDQMRLGIRNKWEEEMPRDKHAGFAAGFRLAMKSSKRDGVPSALSVVCGIYALTCEMAMGARTRIRDRARQALTQLGVISTGQRGEMAHERTALREPWLDGGAERANTDFGRASGALSRMDLPEWTGAAQGGSGEASDIDERTKIDERKEPTRLEDIDWGRSMNLGE